MSTNKEWWWKFGGKALVRLAHFEQKAHYCYRHYQKPSLYTESSLILVN